MQLSVGKIFFQPNRRSPESQSSCVIEFFGRLHVVSFVFVFLGEGRLAYQQNTQDRPSSKKGTVAIQSAFTGQIAYSRKNTSADSSACASLTCESRAYSVILRQKGAAQQGTAVYLAAFHMHPAPPAKIFSLFSLSSFLRHRYGVGVFLNSSHTVHVPSSLNIWPCHLVSHNTNTNK